MAMKYAPHETLVISARPTAELWRLVLGLVVASAVMFGLARGMMAALGALMSPDGYIALVGALEHADTPFGVLALLLLAGVMGLGVVVAAEVLHERGIASLIGPWPLFRYQFWKVLAALFALLMVVAILPPWPLARMAGPGLPFGLWLAFLPLTFLAILVQTGSEELMFRGYFQSQLAARFKNPLVWMTIPSIAFALGHYAPNIYGENALLVMVWSFLFGLAAADLTARSGTLGPAVALHLANNFAAVAVTALQGDMSGLALAKLPFGADDIQAVRALLPIDLAVLGLSWLTARLALRA